MGIGEWFSQNWFNVFSAAGIIAGLTFTAFSLRSEAKTRRIAHLLTITANHRELWQELLNNPKLARVLDSSVNLGKRPVTAGEEIFVILVFLHTSSVYYAMKDELVVKLEGCICRQLQSAFKHSGEIEWVGKTGADTWDHWGGDRPSKPLSPTTDVAHDLEYEPTACDDGGRGGETGSFAAYGLDCVAGWAWGVRRSAPKDKPDGEGDGFCP